jgi:hypothetical protein
LSDGFGPALKPHPTDAGRQIRKPACFDDGRSDQSDRLGNQNLPQEGHGNARQTFFNRGTRRCNALEGAGDFAHVRAITAANSASLPGNRA